MLFNDPLDFHRFLGGTFLTGTGTDLLSVQPCRHNAFACSLPEQYADILRLKIVYHLDDHRIAKVLAIKPQNARTRLSRARAVLMKLMKEENLV